jgi:hypothetical protein
MINLLVNPVPLEAFRATQVRLAYQGQSLDLAGAAHQHPLLAYLAFLPWGFAVEPVKQKPALYPTEKRLRRESLADQLPQGSLS